MREVEQTQIGGRTYRCTMMPGMKAHGVLFRLLDYVGAPVLATIARAFRSDGGEIVSDVKVDELVEFSTQLLFSKLDDAESARLIRDVFDGVYVVENDTPWDTPLSQHADELFRGEVLTMWKVWAWAFEVNYRDFSSAVRSSQIPGWVRAAKERARESMLQTLASGSGGSSETDAAST